MLTQHTLELLGTVRLALLVSAASAAPAPKGRQRVLPSNGASERHEIGSIAFHGAASGKTASKTMGCASRRDGSALRRQPSDGNDAAFVKDLSP